MIKQPPKKIAVGDGSEQENDCPLNLCDGSGEVPDSCFDNDSKTWIDDGMRPCPHLKRDDSED